MERKKMQELQNKIIGQRNNIGLTKGFAHDTRKRQFIKKGILGIIAGLGIAVFSKITGAVQNVNFADDATSITSGQIAFPGTQATSAGANTLDDYEEGTFSPLLFDGTTTATATVRVGRYTKIGNRVLFNLRVNCTNATSLGSLRITGLPFASNATSNGDTAFAIGYTDGMAITATANVGASTEVGTSNMYLWLWDGTMGTGGSPLQGSEFTNSGQVTVAGQYEV